MKKFKWFLRFDKEEKWLEEMANQGWLLSRKSMFYDFQKIDPERKIIRIDFIDSKSEKDFVDYCILFEDSGWKHIAGTKMSGTQYFLKVNDDSIEEIFSDEISRAGRYKRLSNLWLFWSIVFMPLSISMRTGGWINLDILFTPKEWYLTPGLWELSEYEFWLSFFFESPIALMRGVGWMVPIVAILICVGFAIKSRLLYRSATLQKEE